MTPLLKSILIAAEGDDIDAVHFALQQAMPELPVFADGEDYDAENVAYAAVWYPRSGLLATLPNLEAIFSLGAGIDHILEDRLLPSEPPIVRLVHGKTRELMRDYVIHAVLHYYRMMDIAADLQNRRLWQFLSLPEKSSMKVGMLGLGEMGGSAAGALVDLGFNVMGWSRSPKSIPKVESFVGEDGLLTMLSRTNCLVSILPATPETIGCMNAAAFAAMPKGSNVVNIGRGNHLVVDDLLAALDKGHLAGATLDVFDTEPLNPDSPVWTHPKIRVTPHVAGFGSAESVAEAIAKNIRRMDRGLQPMPLGDRLRGY